MFGTARIVGGTNSTRLVLSLANVKEETIW